MEREVPTAEVGDIVMMCQVLASHHCSATIGDIKAHQRVVWTTCTTTLMETYLAVRGQGRQALGLHKAWYLPDGALKGLGRLAAPKFSEDYATPKYSEDYATPKFSEDCATSNFPAAMLNTISWQMTDELLMGGNGNGMQRALVKLRERQLTQGADYSFTYDMTAFVRKLLPIQIEKGRKKTDSCSAGEVGAFRTLLGALLLAACGALPQILGDLLLLDNRINILTVEALMLLNRTLKRAQELTAPISNLIRATSRQRLAAGKCQTSLLHYTSKKMKRVASSTLMTEACALTSFLSELVWWIEWWYRANHATYRSGATLAERLRKEEVQGQLEGLFVVDSKSIYNVLRKIVAAGRCKKAALEVLAAADTLRLRGLALRWQAHEWNVADLLTKLHGHAEPLLKLTYSGLAQLLPECQHLENRAVERQEQGYNSRSKRYSVETLTSANVDYTRESNQKS
eukprot:6465419-Amphidinium_carterae.1